MLALQFGHAHDTLSLKIVYVDLASLRRQTMTGWWNTLLRRVMAWISLQQNWTHGSVMQVWLPHRTSDTNISFIWWAQHLPNTCCAIRSLFGVLGYLPWFRFHLEASSSETGTLLWTSLITLSRQFHSYLRKKAENTNTVMEMTETQDNMKQDSYWTCLLTLSLFVGPASKTYQQSFEATRNEWHQTSKHAAPKKRQVKGWSRWGWQECIQGELQENSWYKPFAETNHSLKAKYQRIDR